MGSAGPKHFWRTRMACHTVAKTSLVHRFTQVLLNPGKEEKGVKDEDEDQGEELYPASAAKLTSRRMRLELDVERLHDRLQQETDLHSALENAIAHAAGAFATFPRNVPPDAQELLTDVAMLEVAVSRLEEQMIGLKLQIRHERNERFRDAPCRSMSPLSPKGMVLQERLDYKSRDLTADISLYGRTFKGSVEQVYGSKCSDDMVQSAIALSYHSQPYTSTSEITSLEEENVESAQCTMVVSNQEWTRNMLEIPGLSMRRDSDAEDGGNGVESSATRDREGDSNVLEADLPRSAMKAAKPLVDGEERRETKLNDNMQGKFSSVEYSETMWRQPNRLSEEMVSCMIGIYCHLAEDPSEVAAEKHINSDNVPSPSSPFGHVTSSSSSSLSDLSNLSFARSPPFEPKIKEEKGMESSNVDPYRTLEKLPTWGDIGSYSTAVEVSWMSVGKEQLEYAADALRIFRCLVEQLFKVDATSLGHQEKLAFWINVYNALMMHAYLAYGVPKNDVKYFALMQKAAYTVGGQFFNAMAIEHVLLRGRAPSYRPQIALLLALHKLKIPEGSSKLAISRREPLVMFALSCGAWSSPAVRIYTPENVQAQLRAALHDYVRASVSVNRHGKVLVPKLLHCYVRDLNLQPATGEADEGRALALWICTFLPAHQANLVRDALQQRVVRPNSSVISIQPFDFRLRYLFLH